MGPDEATVTGLEIMQSHRGQDGGEILSDLHNQINGRYSSAIPSALFIMQVQVWPRDDFSKSKNRFLLSIAD